MSHHARQVIAYIDDLDGRLRQRPGSGEITITPRRGARGVILTKVQRKEILSGYVTELRFPRAEPCPITRGRKYAIRWKNKDDKMQPALGHFEVLTIKETREEWIAEVQTCERVTNLGRTGGYVEGNEHAMQKGERTALDGLPISDATQLLGPEPEPEAVPAVDLAKIGKKAEIRRVKKWEEAKAEMMAQLEDLKDDPEVSRFSSKLRYIEGQLQELDRKVKREAA